jgi:hypothetical protein
MRNFVSVVCVLGTIAIAVSCAKRIPISYDQAKENFSVKIETKKGESYTGLITSKNDSYLEIQPSKKQTALKIAKENIEHISSKPPLYDYQDKVISDWEIKDTQSHNNTFYYTLGGAGLSFGTSFFIGSLLHRGFDDYKNRNTLLWSTTGVGTSVGTYFFLRMGSKKDRNFAIEKIRDERLAVAKGEINQQKKKHEEINDEMIKLKAERERQDTEKKRLMQRIQDRQKEDDDSK